MILLHEILYLLITYIWGSIPFGYFLTKFSTGKNILELGSGNIGSTNVKRVVGKKMSIITQLLDMLKGLIPISLYLSIGATASTPYYVFMLAMAAIIGHDFSIFLKFKGGKGVNTTLGASVLLAPYSVLIAVAIYFLVKWRLKYVSIGSIILALTMPIIELVIHQVTPVFYYLLICATLIILLHRKNIIRLIKGDELTL